MVIPLLNVLSQEGGEDWLHDAGIDVPPSALDGNRAPTPDELRAILERLAGVTVRFHESGHRWYASAHAGASGDAASANDFGEVSILGEGADEVGASAGTRFAFRGGDRRAHLRIVQELSAQLGPQVYCAASDGTPVLVCEDGERTAASPEPEEA